MLTCEICSSVLSYWENELDRPLESNGGIAHHIWKYQRKSVWPNKENIQRVHKVLSGPHFPREDSIYSFRGKGSSQLTGRSVSVHPVRRRRASYGKKNKWGLEVSVDNGISYLYRSNVFNISWGNLISNMSRIGGISLSECIQPCSKRSSTGYSTSLFVWSQWRRTLPMRKEASDLERTLNSLRAPFDFWEVKRPASGVDITT